MMLLPPLPDVCQQCAVDHAPPEPHDQQSLHWQYHFFGRNGRWPTWVDAMAHCSDGVKTLWIELLAEQGVNVGEREENA